MSLEDGEIVHYVFFKGAKAIVKLERKTLSSPQQIFWRAQGSTSDVYVINDKNGVIYLTEFF